MEAVKWAWGILHNAMINFKILSFWNVTPKTTQTKLLMIEFSSSSINTTPDPLDPNALYLVHHIPLI